MLVLLAQVALGQAPELPPGMDGTEDQNFTQPWSDKLATVVIGRIQGVRAGYGKTSWDVVVDEQIGGTDRLPTAIKIDQPAGCDPDGRCKRAFEYVRNVDLPVGTRIVVTYTREPKFGSFAADPPLTRRYSLPESYADLYFEYEGITVRTTTPILGLDCDLGPMYIDAYAMKALEKEAREARVHKYALEHSRGGMLSWTDFLSSLHECVVR